MDRDELAHWLRLMLTPGVGSGTARILLARFGLPVHIFEQSGAALREVVGPQVATALARPPDDLEAQLQATWDWLHTADEAAAPEGARKAVITLADKIRDSARRTIERLRSMDVTPVMVTGDADAVAATVADELGIERYYARVLPQDKARIVGELKQEGRAAFVGDGINDAPALLAADLGVAIGAGTNVAIESADLVLVDNDPADVARALILSRATHRKMMQNLAWATGYNTFAIPLAAGVAAGAGILLSPAVGALLMSISTVIVAINAMLLRRVDLSNE